MSKKIKLSADALAGMDEDTNMPQIRNKENDQPKVSTVEIPTTSFYSSAAAAPPPNQPKAAKIQNSPKPHISTPRRKYTRRAAAGKVLRPTQWDDILANLRNSRLRQLVSESCAVKTKPDQKVQTTHDELPSTSKKVVENVIEILSTSSESDFSDMEATSEAAADLMPPAETPSTSQTRKFFKSGHNKNTPKQVSLFENIKAKVLRGKITLMKQQRAAKLAARRQSQEKEEKKEVTYKEWKQNIQNIIKNLDDSNNNNNNNNDDEPEKVAEKVEEGNWPWLSNDLSHSKKETKKHEKIGKVEKYERQYWMAFLNSYRILNADNKRIFIEDKNEEKMREVIEKYVKNQRECLFYARSCDAIPLPEPRSPYFSIFNQRKCTSLNMPVSSRKNVLRGWGANQRQIDAGQRDFGARKCMHCGLVYSPHEPEDEQVHNRFHESRHLLRFKPWVSEHCVGEYPQWSSDGRILRITEWCSSSQKERLMEIIKTVDTELGFANYNFPEIFVAFLAVSCQEVVGVCIVEPLKKAYKHILIDGQDCRTEEQFPANAGISRIWVSPRKRRKGIATALIEAVKKYTTLFQPLNINRIAFSAPTANGREFAKRVTGSDNFLVYE